MVLPVSLSEAAGWGLSINYAVTSLCVPNCLIAIIESYGLHQHYCRVQCKAVNGKLQSHCDICFLSPSWPDCEPLSGDWGRWWGGRAARGERKHKFHIPSLLEGTIFFSKKSLHGGWNCHFINENGV